MLPLIVDRGRIVCCGVTAQYDMDNSLPGPSDLAMQMIAKSLHGGISGGQSQGQLE